MPTYIDNESPIRNKTGVSSTTLIEFDVLDTLSLLNPITIDAYVDGVLAYDGYTNTFQTPYDGVDSYFGSIIVDGYDGYHIRIDNTDVFANVVPISVSADGYEQLRDSWSFLVGTTINSLYFSDGYGIRKINIKNLVGESQDVLTNVLTTTSTPALKSNIINSIHGNMVDGYLYLSACYDGYDAYGLEIIENEVSLNYYGDGYAMFAAHMTDKGILYVMNKTQNQIEVFYGTNSRDGYGRAPDFVYNTLTTPALFSGTILCLHVVDAASLRLSGGARLYVGTTQGLTRIETYDQTLTGNDAYGAGLDGYGLAITYGIVGSGASFEVVGGTVPNVTSVSSDDEKSIIFVVTNNSISGGLTQINLEGNRKVLFMTQENGFLPTNDIRDVFGLSY